MGATPAESSITSAAATLYRDHHGWLVHFLRRRLGDADNATDLAQDAFVRMLAAGDGISLREPRAYLSTVAIRLVAQFFRRRAVERAYLEVLAARPEEVEPSVETRMLVIEALEAVSQVLDGLQPRTRRIFLLAQFEGRTYPQIAAELGVSVNVVQKAMLKAMMHCYNAVYG